VIFPSSGNDQLLPSIQEGERLLNLLPKSKCELRKFDDSGHFLFLVWISPFIHFFKPVCLCLHSGMHQDPLHLMGEKRY